jgi:hypothetical protein
MGKHEILDSKFETEEGEERRISTFTDCTGGGCFSVISAAVGLDLESELCGPISTRRPFKFVVKSRVSAIFIIKQALPDIAP